MPTFTDEQAALDYLNTLPWGNAAGVLRNHKDAVAYASTGQTITTYGSIIEEKGWSGNAGNNYIYDSETGISINSMGLGDPGIDHHLETLANTKDAVNKHGSKLNVSFSSRTSFDPRAYLMASSRIFASEGADIFEGNFSCGNVVVTGGRRKPIVCLDPSAFDEGVAALREGAGNNEIAVKISPITEERMLADQIYTCIKHDVDYLVFANTIPGGYLEKLDGTPAISMVRGGLAGSILPPIVSGMLMIAKPLVAGTKLKLIATGGIGCKEDRGAVAYRYLKLGAHGFSFNTCVTRDHRGPSFISEIVYGSSDGIPGLLELLVEYGLPD